MPRRAAASSFCAASFPVLIVAVLGVFRPAFLARLDDSVYDILLRSARTPGPGANVAIVDVDERSLSTIGQWPWRRDVVGRLITRLRDEGAAVDCAGHHLRRNPIAPEPAAEAPGAGADAAARGPRHPRLRPDIRRRRRARRARACCIRSASRSSSLRARRGHEPLFHATGAVCNLPMLGEAAAAVRLPERGARRRRHPQARAAARRARRPRLSRPRARGRRGRDRRARRGASDRQRECLGADDRRPDRAGRRQGQSVAPLPREEADVPVLLGGGCARTAAPRRGAARQDRVRRHHRARHARGGGDAARHAVRRRGSAGHGRRQPPAAGLHPPVRARSDAGKPRRARAGRRDGGAGRGNRRRSGPARRGRERRRRCGGEPVWLLSTRGVFISPLSPTIGHRRRRSPS